MKSMIRTWLICLMCMTSVSHAFDHNHTNWDTLVSRHVHWNEQNTASQVDYQSFKNEQSLLNAYLITLSDVSREAYDAWSPPLKLAFLINAYNAFTIDLILTRYPELSSIKDLGGLFTNPWKKKFFILLEEKRNLDWIEHTMIRKPGVFDDPRIHAAVNCASIGCPALWDKAFTAENLDHALDTVMQRFLSDRSRNRYNSSSNTLELSKIFDWYNSDFKTMGFRETHSLHDFLGLYADYLSDIPGHQQQIKHADTPIRFLDYDWNLNALP